jgi:hypothetical protein
MKFWFNFNQTDLKSGISWAASHVGGATISLHSMRRGIASPPPSDQTSFDFFRITKNPGRLSSLKMRYEHVPLRQEQKTRFSSVSYCLERMGMVGSIQMLRAVPPEGTGGL